MLYLFLVSESIMETNPPPNNITPPPSNTTPPPPHNCPPPDYNSAVGLANPIGKLKYLYTISIFITLT